MTASQPEPPERRLTDDGWPIQAAKGIRELRAEVDRLRAAILDIDAHSVPLGEDEDGFVTTGYVISVGSLHRALGLIGHTSPPASTEARPRRGTPWPSQ